MPETLREKLATHLLGYDIPGELAGARSLAGELLPIIRQHAAGVARGVEVTLTADDCFGNEQIASVLETME